VLRRLNLRPATGHNAGGRARSAIPLRLPPCRGSSSPRPVVGSLLELRHVGHQSACL
jgi:hypothetical protein